ncbi:hypothetical protein K3495_g6333 [Podosphaera aphanis]|nr:hypothetical protein K3495_g6333 [Podosphaera aphanis]
MEQYLAVTRPDGTSTLSDQVKSTDFTLRFKHTFCTILLFIDPNASFLDAKKSLHRALCERYPTGLPVNPQDELPNAPKIPIPQSELDIVFGVPRDQKDLAQGFDELDPDTVSQNVKNMGIYDGDALAFAFQVEGQEFTGDEFIVNFPDLASLYGE